MKKFTGVLCAVAMAAGTLSAHAADTDKINERLSHSSEILQEIMAGPPDKQIPQSILAGASCVVVIPSYKKGGFILAADYGQGVATCRTGHGWSAPVFVKLTGGSVGFQIGGESTDLVLVAMNREGLQHMLSDKFKLGADASVAAGPVGRNATAATDATLHAEFLSYSRNRGAFAGISLTGSYLGKNGDDMRLEYGSDLPFKVVLDGEQKTQPNAVPFVRAVSRYFAVAKANQ